MLSNKPMRRERGGEGKTCQRIHYSTTQSATTPSQHTRNPLPLSTHQRGPLQRTGATHCPCLHRNPESHPRFHPQKPKGATHCPFIKQITPHNTHATHCPCLI